MDDISLYKINLSFFDSGEKTEKPTAKKRDKARKEGQVAKSPEVSTAFLFIAVFSSIRLFFPRMSLNLINLFSYSFKNISNIDNLYTPVDLKENGKVILLLFGAIVGPLLAISFIIAFISSFIQVGWHPTTKPLKPKFSKLNPLKGFKRMFSMSALMNFFKSIFKLVIIGFAVYLLIKDELIVLSGIFYLDLFSGSVYIGNLILKIGLNIGLLFLTIALFDYIYQRIKLTKDLKMTKQEIKEEHKSVEGNPQIKQRIRQKMMESSMRRMMNDVPTADVIITNPTHYAVAIVYDQSSGKAPVVVAKGIDHLAQKIKEVGKENNIDIVENKILARTLYSTVDIGKEIPEELYQSVAEILAYIYKLKNKV